MLSNLIATVILIDSADSATLVQVHISCRMMTYMEIMSPNLFHPTHSLEFMIYFISDVRVTSDVNMTNAIMCTDNGHDTRSELHAYSSTGSALSPDKDIPKLINI
jgi:hypothetical protein